MRTSERLLSPRHFYPFYLVLTNYLISKWFDRDERDKSDVTAKSKDASVTLPGNSGNHAYPARSYVCLGGIYREGENGEPLLTPECVTPVELEVWIDHLKEQLDGIKIEARRKYAAYETNVFNGFLFSHTSPLYACPVMPESY